jgi:16S rRNA (guanine966-N2)-methyltransferase
MTGIRIIAGKAKGRVLKSPEADTNTRPILGRIKKSLFDILRLRITGSNFLDLYAGTGAVGIEALSRGAKTAVFLELDNKNLNLIKTNIQNLGLSSQARVERCDITKGLGWLGASFDLIFLGPPYVDSAKKPLSLTGITLDIISKADILKIDGWVISQHHKKEPFAVPASMAVFRQEKYGDTILSFMKLANGI